MAAEQEVGKFDIKWNPPAPGRSLMSTERKRESKRHSSISSQ